MNPDGPETQNQNQPPAMPVPQTAQPVISTPEPNPPIVASNVTPVAPPSSIINQATAEPEFPPVTVFSGDGGIEPTAPAPATSGKKPRKFNAKALLAVLAVVVVLGGGSAAAYVGVILPNKPANILKKGLENSANSTQVSFSGTTNVTSSSLATKVIMKGAANTQAKATDVQANVTVSGVTLPLELRYVGQNAYLKVGDLSTIAGLVNGFSPDLGNLVNQANGIVANKWIEFDSTLINESGANCALDANWNLTPADVKLLETEYGKHAFANITSASTDKVNGQSAEKIVLSLDDDKMAQLVQDNSLKNLSLVKTLAKCDKSGGSYSSDASSLADHDHTPVTVWVDKSSNRIVQVAVSSTAQDKSKDNLSGSVNVQFSYGNVNIQAPAGATPAATVLSQLETIAGSGDNSSLGQLFGGGSTTDDSSATLLN